MINIPIIQDLNSNEGTEYFMVQLSGHSIISDDVVIGMGSIREATVYIQEEILVSFLEEHIQVEERGSLILTVTANAASDEDFSIALNIISNSAHCKLVHKWPEEL